jgi:hypothetical protein
VDGTFILKCELCYDCVDCEDCYGLRYSRNCVGCSDGAFLFGCRNCKDCVGSVNLVGKRHVFFNEQLDAEEYGRRLAALELHRRSAVEEVRRRFEEHRLRYPHRSMTGEMNEDVTGDALHHCHRVRNCFNGSHLEDCARCTWFHHAKDCRDCYSWGYPAEQCYFCTEVGDRAHRVALSAVMYACTDALYSYMCQRCGPVFGCASLKDKKHCVLNRQYTAEEYDALVPRIVAHMRDTGEWGEFFPYAVSPLHYNQSVAQDHFPLDRDAALALGARWGREEEPVRGTPAPLPESIDDVADDVCSRTLACAATGKPYKLITQELAFYREHRIPPPDLCFAERNRRRLAQRNPRRLWSRTCAKCGNAIETSYAPERPEIVYCEGCYLASVY